MSTNSEWTVLEKLLLTQAVYKYGENMWFQVARVLKQHGLLQPNQRQSDFFSQKNCQFQYYLLVENLEAEKQLYRNNDLKNDMPAVVRIAKQLYTQRVEEVKAELKRDEEKFGELAKEIELIRSGQWDEKLRENLSPEDREAMDNAQSVADDNNQLNGSDDSSNLPVSSASMVEDKAIEEEEESVPSSVNVTVPVALEENKILDRITQQENSMKRTSSETTIMAGNSLKRCRLDDSKVSQPSNSSENQIILTATSAATEAFTNSMTETSTIEAVKESNLPKEEITNTVFEEGISIPSATATTEIPKTAYPISMAKDGTMMDTDLPNKSYQAVLQSTMSSSAAAQTIIDALHVNGSAVTAMETEFMDKPKYDEVNGNHNIMEDNSIETPNISLPTVEVPAINPQQPKCPEQQQPSQQNITLPTDIPQQQHQQQPSQHQQQPSQQQQYETLQQQPVQPQQHFKQEQPHCEQPKHLQQPQAQVEQQHQLPQQQYPQQKMTMAPQLPKIIIPESSSSSPSSSYTRFHQDQSASPISKLHNIMTPDEEDFTGSETATPTSTSAAESRRKLNSGDQRQKAWQKNINLLWQEIANHKNGTIFMNPIKKSYAPLYDKVVKQPLYLKTIKNRVRDGIVKTTTEFERDIVLMLTNSLMYNKEGTETYQMALEMLDDVREQIRLFKSADSYSVSLWENDSQQ